MSGHEFIDRGVVPVDVASGSPTDPALRDFAPAVVFPDASQSVPGSLSPRMQNRLGLLLHAAAAINDAERKMSLGETVYWQAKNEWGNMINEVVVTKQKLEAIKRAMGRFYRRYIEGNPDAMKLAHEGLEAIRRKYKEDDGKIKEGDDKNDDKKKEIPTKSAAELEAIWGSWV